jgi:hypothetical protein
MARVCYVKQSITLLINIIISTGNINKLGKYILFIKGSNGTIIISTVQINVHYIFLDMHTHLCDCNRHYEHTHPISYKQERKLALINKSEGTPCPNGYGGV